MFFKRKFIHTLSRLVVCLALLLLFNSNNTIAEIPLYCIDTTVNPNLPYPITDNRGDNFSSSSYNSFNAFQPSNLKDSIVYDYDLQKYIVYEKIGDKYYKTPVSYTFNEYWAIKNRQAEIEYFQKRGNAINILNRGKFLKPKLSLTDNLFNRLFGNGKIDIMPQGNVDITTGYQGQKIDNPTLP
jgi:hypothetical protein